MKDPFIKDLTPEQLAENKKFIEEYDRKAQARETPLAHPLTGDELREIATHKEGDAPTHPSIKPK